MVSILVVTHGDLSKAFISSIELVLGETPMTETLGLYHGDDVEELKDRVRESILKLNAESAGKGVLVFVDLLGGSPSNAVAVCINELKDKINIECIAGVNLPMLIESVGSRTYMDLQELRQACLNAGMEGIINLREKLSM